MKNIALITAASLLFTLAAAAQTVHFTALKGKTGKASVSSAILLNDQGVLATVVEIGSNAKDAKLVSGDKNAPLKLLARDNDSRVALYEVPLSARQLLKVATVGNSLNLKSAQTLHTSPTDRTATSRFVSRVFRFQGKVLPLAVLRVNHPAAAPAPGSGIYDVDGKLIGLVRQAVYNEPNSSYCLPVEVLNRIHQDQQRNNRVRRCWCGIIMDKLVATPIIESIRPDSPAAKAGLKKGDVILSVGPYQVSEYAEVVDAFYYLIAGQPTKFRVLRGTAVMEHAVIPQVTGG